MKKSRARLAVAAAAVPLSFILACGGGGSKNQQANGPASTGGNDYCRLARAYSESYKQFNEPTTAADLREVFAEASRDIKAALAVAPAEIKPDVQVVANGLNAIIAAMEAADYDVTRLAVTPPSLPSNFDAATAHLDKYGQDVCRLSG